ncbi:hypothetical protein [Streptomyces griseosporeus]
MAIAHYSPLPAEIDDPVTLKEAVALFRRTGHPAGETTLRSWIREDGITTVRVGKTAYMSWTDLIQAHARRTAAKLRASEQP